MAKNTKGAAVAKALTAVASGTVKPDGDNMIALVKDAFKAVRERDIMVPDDILATAISKHVGWDDLDDEGKIAFIEKVEEAAKSVSVSDPGISVLVGKMDQTFHNAIGELLTVARKQKASAVSMLANFYRIYTTKEMDGMAMPGTEREHVEGTNYRADKVKTSTGTGEPITTVWTNDFVSAMPEGKTADTIISTIDKEKAAPGTTVYKSKDDEELKDILAAATADRNNLRSMVKRAIKLHHRLVAIRKLNSVGIRFIKGDKATGVIMPVKLGLGDDIGQHFTVVTGGPKPLWMYSADEPSKGRIFSVTQILSMDPALALKGANGGNMADLVATAGKGADEPDPSGEKPGDGTEMDGSVAQATLSKFYNWANVRDNNALVRLKISQAAKDADGKDWLALVGLVYHWAKPIYEANKANYDKATLVEEPAKAVA